MKKTFLFIIVSFFVTFNAIGVSAASSFGYNIAETPQSVTVNVNTATMNMTDLGDVLSTMSPTDNYVLTWNDTGKIWEDRSAASVGDSNETVRFENLIGWNCVGTDKVAGILINGTINCTADETAAGGSFNQTYHDYATNVSYNWTLITYNLWGEWWYNHTLDTYNLWNDAWSSTYNATYASNIDSNETVRIENLTATDCGGTDKVTGVYDNGTVVCGTDQTAAGGGDGNASSACADGEVLFGEDDTKCMSFNNSLSDYGVVAGFNSTYNQTYHDYSTNISINHTLNTYNNWGQWWYNMTDAISTFNQTYHDYSTNVSYNWSLMVFDMWNSTWDVDTDTIFTPTNVAWVNESNTFTATQNMTGQNISEIDCIVFDSGGKICSGT